MKNNVKADFKDTKKKYFLQHNLDVLAKPMNVLYNDAVNDLTQAKKLLSKFMLKK